MNDYNPDCWVVLKMTSFKKGTVTYKILAGWSGSYLHGSSWKLNSGITRVEDHDEYFAFYGSSGSVYNCSKGVYRMNSMTQSVLSGFMDKIEDVPGASIELLPEDTDFMQLDY